MREKSVSQNFVVMAILTAAIALERLVSKLEGISRVSGVTIILAGVSLIASIMTSV